MNWKSFICGMFGGLIVVAFAMFSYWWFGAKSFLEVYSANSPIIAAAIAIFAAFIAARPVYLQLSVMDQEKHRLEADDVKQLLQEIQKVRSKLDPTIFYDNNAEHDYILGIADDDIKEFRLRVDVFLPLLPKINFFSREAAQIIGDIPFSFEKAVLKYYQDRNELMRSKEANSAAAINIISCSFLSQIRSDLKKIDRACDLLQR